MGKRNKKGKRKEKEKRRKFIAKISSDGKIEGKEAKKARKKGISLLKIRNRNISDTRKAQRDFDRRGQAWRSPAKERPSYMPLKIKRSAQRELERDRPRRPSRSSNRTDRPNRKDDDKPNTYTPEHLDVGDDFDEVVTVPEPAQDPTEEPTPEQQEDLLGQQIADMQAGFMESMQQQAAMFQQMQTSQNERMQQLQQQMMNAQAMQQVRPQVAGVKMAAGASGTPMQIARRGVTGAFGRRGMRISGLNL